jgi:hypothetical protein
MSYIPDNDTNDNDFDIEVNELTDEHPRAPTPLNASITLKPHQQTLLARCIDYENSHIMLKEFQELTPYVDNNDYFKTSIAILGDRVGSGKSYVILSLIMSNNINHRNTTIIKSHGYNKVMYYIHDNTQCIKTNLLVVPHNLISQWDFYIKTFGCNIKYKILKNQKTLNDLLNECAFDNSNHGEASSSTRSSTTNNDCNVANVLEQYDLLLVTSTLYNKFANFLNENKIKLQRAIYDEVDNLNIPGCKHIEANFFWFITASYGNILYPRGHNKYEPSIRRFVWYSSGLRHSGFLKNLLMDVHHNVSRSLMKVLIIKNKESYVEASLSLPEAISHYILCKTPHEINILNGVVDRNIMNHLNADDIQGAIAFINPFNKSTEYNIISRVIDKYTRQTTNIQLQINTAREYLYDSEAERVAEICKLEKQLEEVNRKMTLISQRIKDNDLCTICYDTAIGRTVTSCCQNTFCFKCINLWLAQKKLCPLCKVSLNVNDLYVIDNAIIDNQEHVSHTEQNINIDISKPNAKNDKYQNLELILTNMNTSSKVLIFAAYDNTFTNVVPILRKLHMSYEYVKGNTNQINCTIDRYKNGNTRILLVNTQHFGSGLNLENTSDMILFHKFDTEIEKQVIGRAQRYGRKDPLNIHYLLYENEMPTNV